MRQIKEMQKAAIIRKIRNYPNFSLQTKEALVKKLLSIDSENTQRSAEVDFLTDLLYSWMYCDNADIQEHYKWYKSLVLNSNFVPLNIYDRYTDSMAVKFNGNILISQADFILKPEHLVWPEGEFYSDKRTDYSLEMFGLRHYLTRNLIYYMGNGTVKDLETKEELGGFTSDCGDVTVFDLDEVLWYNPDLELDAYIRENLVTVIPDFKGEIRFLTGYRSVERLNEHEDIYTVVITGNGQNNKTFTAQNFIGADLGL